MDDLDYETILSELNLVAAERLETEREVRALPDDAVSAQFADDRREFGVVTRDLARQADPMDEPRYKRLSRYIILSREYYRRGLDNDQES